MDSDSSPQSSLSYQECSIEEISGWLMRGDWQDGVSTDISFAVKCGDGNIDFSAHKLILSIWSPVFADMCYHGNVGDKKVIYIEDVSPTIFETMLKFMYSSISDRQCKDIPFMLKLYKAAITYEIEALKDMCCDIFVSSTPNKNNVFHLLDAGKLLKCESLIQRCCKILETQTAEVLTEQELYNVTPAMLKIILNLPRISFSSPFELVMWVVAWTKNEFLKDKNDKKSFEDILKEFLPLLNLAELTGEEFGRVFSHHKDLMSVEDGFCIFMNITNKGSWPLPSWYPSEPKLRAFRNQRRP
ncbi:BTB domain-containing protein [Trichonephila inaurata madagascariensis]|uniref:BTB domain-containing protein n=1 Tax=Trichonephila inaurata madagascariensis TaxID=2747483 RepID=A0A8X7CMN4_9ARAC|nr:BTB domain-containing protein [Trichonephila inaurata madagascariensis]